MPRPIGVAQRIVAEQRQVPGRRAGGDAVVDRHMQAAFGAGGEGVEVGRARRFQLGRAAGRARQPAEPVHHQQQDAPVVGRLELRERVARGTVIVYCHVKW